MHWKRSRSFLQNPNYRQKQGYEWLLIIEDLNSNSTEIALAEYSGNSIANYTILRITKNSPLKLKQHFNSFEQGHNLW